MQTGQDRPRTIAVIGSASPVGGAVLDRLSDEDIHLLAIDVGAVGLVPPRAEVRQVDARDRLLSLALEDVDVVIHAAITTDLTTSPDASYGVNVGGTRNVIDACAKADVGHLVMLSSWMVYGAHPDNEVPLDEAADARANPMVAQAHHLLLAERELADHATAHPNLSVTVMRVGPLLGPGAEGLIPTRLNGPRLVVPAGGQALWQFAHPDDVGAAVALVVDQQLTGTFNVACDGWMTDEEVARARGRSVLEVGQAVIEAVLRAADQQGLAPAPPEVLPFLLHPVVLDVTALRGAGWRPMHTNRQVLNEFAESVGDRVDLGPLTLSVAALRKSVLTAAAVLLVGAWRLRRRRKRS